MYISVVTEYLKKLEIGIILFFNVREKSLLFHTNLIRLLAC